MFLVLEKKVLTFDDDTRELDLYFLEKHTKRMGQELTAYMGKMNFSEKSSCWKVHTKQRKNLYIYAKNEEQARAFTISQKYEPIQALYVPGDKLMHINGSDITIGSLKKGKQTPSLLGIDDVKNYESEWIK